MHPLTFHLKEKYNLTPGSVWGLDTLLPEVIFRAGKPRLNSCGSTKVIAQKRLQRILNMQHMQRKHLEFSEKWKKKDAPFAFPSKCDRNIARVIHMV